MERGLVDLTIRWVDRVKNKAMTTTLLRILAKLACTLNKGMERVLGVGRELALRASILAVEWGDSLAYGWRNDQGFHRALGFRITG